MTNLFCTKNVLLPPNVVHLSLLLLIEHVENGPALSVGEPEILGYLMVHLHGPVLVEDVQSGNLFMGT